jgi:hypothetical protein
MVCSTVKHLHKCLTDALPRVKDLVRREIIHPEDFSHEKYNGCEIIP